MKRDIDTGLINPIIDYASTCGFGCTVSTFLQFYCRKLFTGYEVNLGAE